VVEKGGYKKTLIESNGLFPILDHHDPPGKLVGMLKRMKSNVNYFSAGYLMSMLLPLANGRILRRWSRTLRQLFKAVKEV
jgi:hypothetical protein